MARYRILYLSSQFPTKSNPQIGVFSVERVRALTRSGCQVGAVAPLLMTPPPGLVRRPSLLAHWLRQQARLPDRSSLGEIEVRSPKWLCPPRPIFGWYLSEFEYAQIRRAALQAAAELQPQVILSSWLPDGVAAVRLGKQLGVPVLCIADGTDVNEWPEKYPGWHHARKILNEQAASLIYVSEALRLTGVARGLQPRYEAVIYNSVDVQVFKPEPDSRENKIFSILAVGRMASVKGYAVLLEAFAQLSPRLEKPARLIFVGDGPLRQVLETQAADLGIASQVQFCGTVTPEHMPAYYQAADLLCLPSLSEGMPCVAVEAMACGKPVVASRVGGVPELVDVQSGILVSPGDPKALCEALLKAAGREWDAQAIRQKIVDGFSWTQWTDKVFQVIHSVMADRPIGNVLDERERKWLAWR